MCSQLQHCATSTYLMICRGKPANKTPRSTYLPNQLTKTRSSISATTPRPSPLPLIKNNLTKKPSTVPPTIHAHAHNPLPSCIIITIIILLFPPPSPPKKKQAKRLSKISTAANHTKHSTQVPTYLHTNLPTLPYPITRVYVCM